MDEGAPLRISKGAGIVEGCICAALMLPRPCKAMVRVSFVEEAAPDADENVLFRSKRIIHETPVCDPPSSEPSWNSTFSVHVPEPQDWLTVGGDLLFSLFEKRGSSKIFLGQMILPLAELIDDPLHGACQVSFSKQFPLFQRDGLSRIGDSRLSLQLRAELPPDEEGPREQKEVTEFQLWARRKSQEKKISQEKVIKNKMKQHRDRRSRQREINKQKIEAENLQMQKRLAVLKKSDKGKRPGSGTKDGSQRVYSLQKKNSGREKFLAKLGKMKALEASLREEIAKNQSELEREESNTRKIGTRSSTIRRPKELESDMDDERIENLQEQARTAFNEYTALKEKMQMLEDSIAQAQATLEEANQQANAAAGQIKSAIQKESFRIKEIFGSTTSSSKQNEILELKIEIKLAEEALQDVECAHRQDVQDLRQFIEEIEGKIARKREKIDQLTSYS